MSLSTQQASFYLCQDIAHAGFSISFLGDRLAKSLRSIIVGVAFYCARAPCVIDGIDVFLGGNIGATNAPSVLHRYDIHFPVAWDVCHDQCEARSGSPNYVARTTRVQSDYLRFDRKVTAFSSY